MAVLAPSKPSLSTGSGDPRRYTRRSRYLPHKLNWSNFESSNQALDANKTAWAQRSDAGVKSLFASLNCQDSVLAKTVSALGDRRYLGGVLSIKAYAADRLVLAAYTEPSASQKLQTKVGKWSTSAASVLRLDKPSESRRSFKIGGRWRSRPQSTRFTSWAKAFVADAAHLVEHNREAAAVFLTLTFPGRSAQLLELLACASGYLVDRFNRWLRYKAAGSSFVYVWEKHKSGWPHLHYLFKCSSGADYQRIAKDCQAEWRAILLDLCEQTGCDFFERESGGSWLLDPAKPFVSARIVYVGLAKYLSKYMSKSASKTLQGAVWRPGRWWGCSANLRSEVLANRLTVKLKFGSEGEASALIAASFLLAGQVFATAFVCDSVKTHGALVVCVAVPRSSQLSFARALADYGSDGDVTGFLSVVNRYRTPLKAA